MPAWSTHQEQQGCADQRGFHKFFPSCLTWQMMRNEELTQELLSLAKESIHPPGLAHQSSPKQGKGRAAGRPHSAQRGKVRDTLPFHQPPGEQGSTRPLLLSPQSSLRMQLPLNMSSRSWKET